MVATAVDFGRVLCSLAPSMRAKYLATAVNMLPRDERLAVLDAARGDVVQSGLHDARAAAFDRYEQEARL